MKVSPLESLASSAGGVASRLVHTNHYFPDARLLHQADLQKRAVKSALTHSVASI